MKCDICSKTLATTILNKIKGTYVKDEKKKKRVVCFECQKRLGTKEKMQEEL